MTLPDHTPGCARLIAWVDSHARPRRRFFHGGGWACPRCTANAAKRITAHLDDLPTPPVLYLGELDDGARRTAQRQARRLADRTLLDVGRVLATRDAETCLLLAEQNLTPRTGAMHAYQRDYAIAHFADELTASRVRRVTYSPSWRPASDTTASQGGVRVGTATASLIDEAIRAAGYEPDMPTAAAPAEVAANIAFHLERLRADQDPDREDVNGWVLRRRAGRLNHSWRTDRDPSCAVDYGEESWVS